MVTSDPMLIGVLQAHKSWVSVITWQVLSAGSSKSSLLQMEGNRDLSVLSVNGDVLSSAVLCTISCLLT